MAQDPLGKFKAVIIGGSAGSLEIVLEIIDLLPKETEAIVMIILHRKNEVSDVLEKLIEARSGWKVRNIEDKDQAQPGTIYLAPPDYHLLMEDQANFSLDVSDKVHYSRPSIDVSFESVAQAFGPVAIGVLLSGANSDGAAGLKKIQEAGGYTIVQDPATAEVGFMPEEAIKLSAFHHIVDGQVIPQRLSNLLSGKT